MGRAFSVDFEDLAAEIRRAAAESISKEGFKVRAVNILTAKVFSPLAISPGRYDFTLVSGGRADALYGHVVIEYEKPRTFNTGRGYEHAVEQVKQRIREHAGGEPGLPRYFGVVLDGYRIGFVRWREKIKDFESSRRPLKVNSITVARLVEAVAGLKRKALNAEELLNDFGPGSRIAENTVRVFYRKLSGKTATRTRVLFRDWRRVFSQVCAYSPEKLGGLKEAYGFEAGAVDVEKLLFSLHTYYALIVKLLAAEVASLYVSPKLLSYLERLEDTYFEGHEKLRCELGRLEEGEIFSVLGITNFPEADYFAWYLDEWDGEIAGRIAEIVKKLSDYDPSTAELEPERVRDLFKRLYQNLVPRKVRHDLGEYYTPDWLAELMLDEAGWTLETFERKRREAGGPLAPLDLRVLDPACGSGTFLVLAISRIREYVEENCIDRRTAVHRIIRNIVGFDLNPLAVIAARANYLIALGDLLREVGTGQTEIPVYLADSILVERDTTLYGSPVYKLKTAVGDFTVPAEIIEKGMLPKALRLLEDSVGKYSVNEFKGRLLREARIDGESATIMAELFSLLDKLEREGKNGIWLRILRNAFAPLFRGKFDCVVGNPPWVNWENLPGDYREATKPVWEKYGLRAKASAAQFELGKMKRDLSMLFTYVCADRYLNDNGTLGFLITQMVFKTRGAEVFRRFTLPDGKPLKVLKVHDMVSLKPFEKAANMTSAILLRKGEETEYPIPYIRWTKTGETDFSSMPLREVLSACKREALLALPVNQGDKASQWLTVRRGTLKALEKIRGKPAYKPHLGVNTGGANGVYWVKIVEKLPSRHVLIENLHKTGKLKLVKAFSRVEADLLYKLVRSGDLDKWLPKPEAYIIVPHTRQTDWQAIPENKLKNSLPETYRYFLKFREVLLKRSAYRLLRRGHPFYIMVDVRSNSFAPFKVAWRRMGNKINAAVLAEQDDPYIGRKPLIPQETISFVPLENREEAYYLCALLNSSCVNFLVKSFSQLGGKSFATPSVLGQIRIPKFSEDNRLHSALAKLAERAHRLAEEGLDGELAEVENEIDRLVAELYGLNDRELFEVKRRLAAGGLGACSLQP